MEWQPIETAPKDGEEFMVWDGARTTLAYWWSVGRCWWARDFNEELKPTHWMPIPPPPGRRGE